MKPQRILETVLYSADLDAAAAFYSDVLGLDLVASAPGRHVFFRVGNAMLLIFNPAVTQTPVAPDAKPPVPAHGTMGHGHACFGASAAEIAQWRAHLERRGIAIESDFEWPQGGRSIYFRDPAGNCLEFAEPRIWGLD